VCAVGGEHMRMEHGGYIVWGWSTENGWSKGEVKQGLLSAGLDHVAPEASGSILASIFTQGAD
jgi:hypothetical protein